MFRIIPIVSLFLLRSSIYPAGNGVSAQPQSAAGLYLATPREIFFVREPVRSVSGVTVGEIAFQSESYARITGLAFDAARSLIFWSDISISGRGIYQGTVTSTGEIINNKTLINTDIEEVNCISVDWVHANLYWTDARKRTVEVYNYNNQNHRVLISDGLVNPRGIYADPINGYLFWNDQGRRRIERSYLDGSYRSEIVSGQRYPNQMVVDNRNLYWVNSDNKTLYQSNLDGSGVMVRGNFSSFPQHIFGLAINPNKDIYITNWGGNVFDISLSTDASTQIFPLENFGTSFQIFSAIYYNSVVQPPKADNCPSLGCSHLCLGVDKSTVRCSCPSFGGWVKRKGDANCTVASGNILLYALGGSGYVGFTPTDIETEERYFIGRSLRPVAVAYDPTEQVVYWSDVSQRTIYRIRFDGKGQSVILSDMNGLGIVDGMTLDYTHRKLYYSHYGYIYIDGSPFTWHKIEVLDLAESTSSSQIIRTLVTEDQKPRAIVIDVDEGYLYYTDWSERARIVRTNLDGSDTFELRSGLDNPNGLALVRSGSSKRLFYIDSHEKTRVNKQYPVPESNGTIYSMTTDGKDFKQESPAGSSSYGLVIPYGISYNPSTVTFYVSDWGKNSVVALNPNSGYSGQELLRGVESPMMVLYTPYSISSTALNPCSSDNGGCTDACFTSPTANSPNAVCACNSYSTETATSSSKSCADPSGFAVVGDMNSLKLYGLDGIDLAVYTAVQASPYFSNLVATVHDPSTNYIYYSDVNSKWIMRVGFGGNATQFFRINHVIDGMTISNSINANVTSRLYWTDSTHGQIAYIDLPSDGSSPNIYTVLVSGLTRPRAIKLYNGYLYWSEWGEKLSGKVSRISLSSGGPKYTSKDATVLKDSLNWANGLFIDKGNNRLYISDGHPDSKNVFNCSTDGSQCDKVPNIAAKAKHIFDIWVVNDIVYYSDWVSNAVVAYSPRYSMSWQIMKNLMRPTQFHLNIPASVASRDYCRDTNGGCKDVCVSLLGSSKCACTGGKLLSVKDGVTCVDPGIQQCTYTPQVLVGYLDDTKVQVCTGCQCLSGNTGYAISGDNVYNSSRCYRTGYCPAPACGGDGSTSIDPETCCPVCKTKCDVQITNCPSVPIVLRMTAESSIVQDIYTPSFRVCQVTPYRIITPSRSPSNSYYHYTKELINATWTASVEGGTPDNCNYQIQIIDEIPPKINCPTETVIIYAQGETAKLQFSVASSDNTGQPSYPKCTPEFGEEQSVGNVNVSCITKDPAGNAATCQFNITILKNPALSCETLHINNGHLQCNVINNVFQCDIFCDADGVYNYYNTQPFNQARCVDGTWKGGLKNPVEINPNVFPVTTCKRRINKPVSGNVTIIGRGDCRNNINLAFTVDAIQKKITEEYLFRSYFPLVSLVVVDGCDKHARTKPRQKRDLLIAGKNDVKAQLVISGMYTQPSDRTTLHTDIDSLLNLIGTDFNRGFFKLIYTGAPRDPNWVNDPPPDLEVIPSVDGCLEGTVDAGDGCDVCPAGMYTKDRIKCIPCEEGTYNQWEAQYECSLCPDNQHSQLGAYSFYQCKKNADSCPKECIIGLAVGFSGLIILVLILIIIALAIHLRRSKKNEKKATNELKRADYEIPDAHRNNYPKEQYDEINDDLIDPEKYYND